MLRFTSLILAGAVAALSASGGAQAQSCFAMQAEMLNLMSRNQGTGGGNARYERAFREQARVIARTERHARSAGCFGGGFFLFRREQSRVCRTLMPKLQEMQANLARLDQMRRRPGNNNDHRMRELQGMMQARGCDLPGGRFLEASPDGLWEDESYYLSRGTYRTLCVRTCDGYYFPISFSTVPGQFEADEQSCRAMCPGAESRLYYHLNPGGGPEDMVSVGGEPYSSLPAAFQYRTSFNESCSCRPEGGYSTVASTPQQRQSPVADLTAPLPRARPAPGEDPETMANRNGGLIPSIAADDGGPATTAAITGGDGPAVRVVGPAYWGAPQHDALVIAPVPN